MKIFGITIKTSADKLIDEIEQAYSDRKDLTKHFSYLKNKAMIKYLEENEKRFESYIQIKSKFEIIREKAMILSLYGCQMSMQALEEDLQPSIVIFKFSNRE